jgi:hypothetical protein
MDEKLWAGADLKLQYAGFHLQRMGQSLQPPERTHWNVAREASGAIIDTGWQRSFYPHFDAFLSATRSVAEIIKCCFGVDDHRAMTTWFDQLPAEEQDRRRAFWKQFQSHYELFCKRPLCAARRVSEHRTGYPPVTVTISGMFGVTYVGGPTTLVPGSETRPHIDPPLRAMPIPIRPHWDNFEIDGKGLFPACQDHLNSAGALIAEARRIAEQVHGTHSLTHPPS